MGHCVQAADPVFCEYVSAGHSSQFEAPAVEKLPSGQLVHDTVKFSPSFSPSAIRVAFLSLACLPQGKDPARQGSSDCFIRSQARIPRLLYTRSAGARYVYILLLFIFSSDSHNATAGVNLWCDPCELTQCSPPSIVACVAHTRPREMMLFIGTQFSNLYTAVDTPV
jgi:hypothetical protein